MIPSKLSLLFLLQASAIFTSICKSGINPVLKFILLQSLRYIYILSHCSLLVMKQVVMKLSNLMARVRDCDKRSLVTFLGPFRRTPRTSRPFKSSLSNLPVQDI